jgi:hypothetical protein
MYHFSYVIKKKILIVFAFSKKKAINILYRNKYILGMTKSVSKLKQNGEIFDMLDLFVVAAIVVYRLVARNYM